MIVYKCKIPFLYLSSRNTKRYKMARDPVCGMQVDEKSGVKSVVGGKEVYFCCSHCKSRFDKDPSKFKI